MYLERELVGSGRDSPSGRYLFSAAVKKEVDIFAATFIFMGILWQPCIPVRKYEFVG